MIKRSVTLSSFGHRWEKRREAYLKVSIKDKETRTRKKTIPNSMDQLQKDDLKESI